MTYLALTEEEQNKWLIFWQITVSQIFEQLSVGLWFIASLISPFLASDELLENNMCQNFALVFIWLLSHEQYFVAMYTKSNRKYI